MRDFERDFGTAIEDGLGEGLWDARQEAIRRSSGPYSQPELDAMDNPYARRHGDALLDPGTINVQTGAFRMDWGWPEVMRTQDGLAGRFINDSDVADFLRLGTRYMLPRPIEEETTEYAGNAAERRIERHLKAWARKAY